MTTTTATSTPPARKTRQITDRRTLRFGRMDEILADIEKLDAVAPGGGSIRAAGNWTAAMNVDHVTRLINASLDGFAGARFPLWLRTLGSLMRGGALNKPLRAGFKFHKSVSELLSPDPDISWEQAVSNLRGAVGRTSVERMEQRSPLLGELNHEEWIMLHCRHAELHFSFLHADE